MSTADEKGAIQLPAGSTEASCLRYHLALDITAHCPAELGREIALTGSASRGEAKEDSDIEINCWVDDLPKLSKRSDWLRSSGRTDWLRRLGVTDLTVDPKPIEDESIWATFRLQGIWIEVGWQSIRDQEALLRQILAGEVSDHDRFLLAWIIAKAVPLRSTGILQRWQAQLAEYPDSLVDRLITVATMDWVLPLFIDARWEYAKAGEWLPLTERLVGHVRDTLRILFAINRQWEPNYKHLETTLSTLTVRPDRLLERINNVFSATEPSERVRHCLTLMRDTLKLVPSSIDVSRAMQVITDSLRAHGG